MQKQCAILYVFTIHMTVCTRVHSYKSCFLIYTGSFVGSCGPSRYRAASRSPTSVGLSRRQASLVSTATSQRMHRPSFVSLPVSRTFCYFISQPFLVFSSQQWLQFAYDLVHDQHIKWYSSVKNNCLGLERSCFLSDYGCTNCLSMGTPPVYLDIHRCLSSGAW